MVYAGLSLGICAPIFWVFKFLLVTASLDHEVYGLSLLAILGGTGLHEFLYYIFLTNFLWSKYNAHLQHVLQVQFPDWIGNFILIVDEVDLSLNKYAMHL